MEKAVQGETGRRNIAVDFLKTVAILGVVTIHCCTSGYQNEVGSVEWCSALFWGSIARGSVPVFFMCTGVLMLAPEKELPIKKLYGKNILRLLAAMAVWAMFYKCYHLATNGGLTLGGFVQSLKETVLFKQESFFYYLHITLLIYVLLPVIRVFIRYAKRRELEYALAVWFVLGILYPTVRSYWPFTLLGGIPQQWRLNMAYASIGYCMLGYYIKRYPLPRAAGWAMLFGGFAIIFGGTYLMSLRQGSLCQDFFEGMSVGPALLAAGLFTLGVQCTVPMPKACIFFSKASFCIYLVHMFILVEVFRRNGFTIFLGPCLVTIPVQVICDVALSCLVYLVLSKIPVVKRYLV